MRARARAAFRFSETARARWLLNARPVAKTGARIVFLSDFSSTSSYRPRAHFLGKKILLTFCCTVQFYKIYMYYKMEQI